MMKTASVVFLVSVITVVVVAAPDQLLSRTKRLTAFGKTPTNSSPPPTSGRGRECKSNRDCDAILYTSCSTDPRDSKKRCICKDGTHPSNGQCLNRPRERRGYVPVGGRRHSGADDMMLFRPAPTPPFFPTQKTTTTERPLFKPRINLGLRETCTRDADCLEGAECKHNVNATQSQQQRGLVCLCIEGRVEMNNECNGTERITQNGSIVVLLYLVSYFFRNN